MATTKEPTQERQSIVASSLRRTWVSFHLFVSQSIKANRMHAGPSLGPVYGVGILLGMTSAMVISALAYDFSVLFDAYSSNNPANTSIAIGAAFLALSVGVRFPHRFAVWFCTLTWRRLSMQGQGVDVSRAMFGTSQVDRPLYWIVLAVISMAGGLVIAAWPWGRSLSHSFYAAMHQHFVWSDGPHALLKTFLVFFAGLVPLSILGLAMSCLHHLSCPHGRWDAKATVWLLIGASLGLFCSAQIGQKVTNTNLLMMAAAVPALLVGVAGACTTATQTSEDEKMACATLDLLPIWTDPWPRHLRVSIVAVGGCSAFIVALWMVAFAGNGGTSVLGGALMLLAIGIGALAGCEVHRHLRHSIGSFGLACATAGGLLSISYLMQESAIAGSSVLDWCIVSATGFALGFALVAGRLTLLDRVANRSSTGNVMLARVLVCSALCISVAVPLFLRSFGVGAANLFAALVLLVIGASLIQHESAYSVRSRRTRFAAVVACIGTVILLG